MKQKQKQGLIRGPWAYSPSVTHCWKRDQGRLLFGPQQVYPSQLYLNYKVLL